MKKREPAPPTGAELRRSAEFEAEKGKLEAQGYGAKDLTLDLSYVNKMGLVVLLPVLIPMALLFFLRNGGGALDQVGLVHLLLLIPLFLLATVAHELIHGLFFGLFAKRRFKAIGFGVMWRTLNPYCSCGDALTKGQYALGAAMPTVLLGLVPLVLAVWNGSYLLFLFGAAMTVGGGGDALVLLKLLRHPGGGDALYMDHPTQCGLVIFEKNHL